MDIKRIVTAVDLGPDTEKVLAYAAWLAGMAGGGAVVTLLHVMDYALTPPAYLLPYFEEEKKQNRAKLDRWAERLRGSGIAAECEIAIGRLIDTFSLYLREKGTDILVMGFKPHVIKLSSSERMVRSLRQAMLVVRGAKSQDATTGLVNIKKILCPVDFSDESIRALQWAGFLANGSNSELVVIHVIEDTYLRSGSRKISDEKARKRYLNETAADAENRLAALFPASDRMRRLVRQGDPLTVIAEVAAELDIDLIVMGARGLTFLEGILLGSVSEAVIKSSPCPVLIVHQK